MMTNEAVENRLVQFDLLRILAMLGVLMNHVFNYGLLIYGDFRVDASTFGGFMTWSILELMKLVVLPSVNCYILITGYFLIDRTKLRLRGIWKVWSTTWLYAVGIYLLAVLTGLVPFEWGELQRHATPLLSNSYWFVTSYLTLMLLAPLLAWFLNRLSHRQYLLLLAIGGFVCFQPLLGWLIMDGQQIILFVYLFMIGGYIRCYADKLTSTRYPLLAFVTVLLVMFAYTLYKNTLLKETRYVVFAMAYHGLVLPLSVALFMIIRRWEIKSSEVRRCILFLAPLSFAVYIIHTQSLVDSWLWGVSSEWLSDCDVRLLPFACITITLVVFVVCVLIEYVRVGLNRLLRARWRQIIDAKSS